MRLKKRDMILIAAIVPLAIVALFWWFHARPASQHLSELRTQVSETRSQVTGLQATLAALGRRQPNLAAQAAEELRLAKAVPASTQVPASLVEDTVVTKLAVIPSPLTTPVTVPVGVGTGAP